MLRHLELVGERVKDVTSSTEMRILEGRRLVPILRGSRKHSTAQIAAFLLNKFAAKTVTYTNAPTKS